jgi:hypothetical protein
VAGDDRAGDNATREGVGDAVAYGVAAVALIVLGALLRTPILNFLCGPAFVIAVVTLLAPRIGRRK